MDLNKLYQIMREKGYHYCMTFTNGLNNNISLSFSTGFNGRGNSIEVTIGEQINQLLSYIDKSKQLLKDVSDDDIFSFLKEIPVHPVNYEGLTKVFKA